MNQFYDHSGQAQYYDEDGNKYQPSNKAKTDPSAREDLTGGLNECSPEGFRI
jgi:hypothetical protein